VNEADTRARKIEPKLKASGWTGGLVTREFYYQRDHEYTKGQLTLVGNEARRGKPRKVDYLLRYSDGFAIAAIEAKPDEDPADAGLEQAKAYARDLGLAFAYSTNGDAVVEYDFFTKSSRTLDLFPPPAELWARWKRNIAVGPDRVAEASGAYDAGISDDRQTNPLLHSYCAESVCGSRPYYFQEVAVRRVIQRFLRGQRRVLLAMATGSGKTFVAFQMVWKLIKSGWLKRLHPERPGRVLFLADRVFLRDQAYNTFSPLAGGASDPRHAIGGKDPFTLNRDVYFGIYQALWAPDENGRRLFERIPRNFFDLVIIDECHRSGFGTWREILDHFQGAMHLGMTATPKREDNIDTYVYFCAEEPEVAVDPSDPSAGTYHAPAFEYSLGQGIEDGFLATYKVHRVRTTVDASGLRLEDALEQGAEVFIPEEAVVRDVYTTPQFEREITLPDRTRRMVEHLAALLRRYGHMDKTMVFCVDMDHARLVARLLQDEFGPVTGFDNYAVPIISEEGEARTWLESLADSDKQAPVVATTAELLTTGVDVPPCRNIVFMKTVSSPVLFKQIIGRGTRLDDATGKLWFRIIDFTGATRLFDEWDRPPGPAPEAPEGPFTASLEGVVFDENTTAPIRGASVSVRTGPNTQQGPIRTDALGRYCFGNLPQGKLSLSAGATGYVQRQKTVETVVDKTTREDISLKPTRKGRGKIRVEGLTVEIADEAIFTIEQTGQRLTLDEYRDHTRRCIIRAAPSKRTLREIWVDPERRQAFLSDLQSASIHPEVLADVLNQSDADQFDLLCHVAFGSPVRTRDDRAAALRNRDQRFINRHAEQARKVILELLEKYRAAGIGQVEPGVFEVSPFREWGGAYTIKDWFGGVPGLRASLQELRERIYPESEVNDVNPEYTADPC